MAGRACAAGRDHAGRWVGAMLLSLGCACADGNAAREVPAMPSLPTLVGDTLTLTPAFAALIGLRTQPVEIADIAPMLHVTGVLEFDERKVSAIGARISGRVRELKVVQGDHVRAGAVLATLESAELGEAQAQIVSIEARARYAAADLRRQQQLLKEGIASQRAVELAMQVERTTAAELRAAKQRVRAIGDRVTGASLGRMSLTAPIEGDVVEVHVFRGQAVEPSHTAFIIADRASLWVRLAVYEGEVGGIRLGDEVEVTTQSGAAQTGKVAFVSSMVEPLSRSVEVRVVVPNEAGTLRVGQAVTARLRPGGALKHALSVPRASLVLVDGKSTVFVAADDTHIIARTVERGIESRELVEIRSGLTAGERVVVEGIFALKSELFR